ncbi:MAG: homoserine dehydrogenase [Alphaproteobacteria bacterium]
MGQGADKAPLRLGIAGLGTVGVGTVKIVAAHGARFALSVGRSIEITAVSARDTNRDRGVDLSNMAFETDARALATREDVDVVVEMIGGSEGIALELVENALANGKSVVTANKALIALHGTRLAKIAEENNVALNYEAAVAGGIPIIKTMREGVAANAINRVYGILNGTCNYILSQMESTGRAFDDVLADAQAKGYAEADPSFDVGGIDAAHKLAILTALAYGTELAFDDIEVEGIEAITADDIQTAIKLGYRIKLIAQSVPVDGGGLEQRVSPALVPLGTPMAAVDDVFNAVALEGDFVDRVFLEGRGAGEGPTASAVVADILDIARGQIMPTFGVPADALQPFVVAAQGAHEGAFFVRLALKDEPGGMAAVTTAFQAEGISISAMNQSEAGHDAKSGVPVVIITHECREAALQSAVEKIAALPVSLATPRTIRIAAF